jgi:hypothetical protein
MYRSIVERIRESKLIRWGIGGLIFGSGPLLLAVAFAHLRGDPNPNPIGPGILCGLTFLPSLICLAIGLFKAAATE